MSPLRGRMRLLAVVFVLTSIEAKRHRLESKLDNLNGRKNVNDAEVDVYPGSFGGAVDFGHVYKNGHRKQGADKDLDVINSRRLEEAKQLLKEIGINKLDIKGGEEPKIFASPRDAMLYRQKMDKAGSISMNRQSLTRPSGLKNETQALRQSETKRLRDGNSSKHSNIQQFFTRSGFNLLADDEQPVANWTSCKEFAKGAVFHPDDVIKLQWLPFFIWSTRGFSTAVIHTLTYPTKKLVQQYKETFGSYLNMKIDWNQPKLLLKEDKEMLLIAGDRKGLFYGIPYVELPASVPYIQIKIEVITIRMKIVDPYLAMMFCDDYYAVIMSLVDSEPATDEEKEAEAAVLKFIGTGSPANRDLELEALKAKMEIEKKLRDEANKYIRIEKPVGLDPSKW